MLDVSKVLPPTLPLLGMGGEVSPLIPLQLHMECCATQGEMNGNVLASIKRGYTRINEYLDKFKGTIAICGAAPSLRGRYQELVNLGADVMACNSAIGYLIEKGIPPRWGMIWDASPLCEAFVTPHPDVTFLVGARCHPSVFEKLKDCRVICWHAGGDHNIAELMVEHQINEPMINGGSAAVTRAMYLAVALGYRNLHVFGADSSYAENGDTHVRGASLVTEKDMKIYVGNGEGSKAFRTTPEWAAQIEEFKAIYGHFQIIGIPITSHCYGMWQHVADLLGMSPHYEQRPLQPQNIHAHQTQYELTALPVSQLPTGEPA